MLSQCQSLVSAVESVSESDNCPAFEMMLMSVQSNLHTGCRVLGAGLNNCPCPRDRQFYPCENTD